MSEAEKKRRAAYKRMRKNWIIAFAIVLITCSVVALCSSLIYYSMNKTFYIDYTEKSSVDYKVKLKDNEFFEDEYLDANQAYVASLIENVHAQFNYNLIMQANNVNYEYSYKIDAQLVITDEDYNAPLFQPIYELVPEQKNTANGSSNLTISEEITIDYNKYNDLANKFLTAYEIPNSASKLLVKMHVKVISVCEEFDSDSNNEYLTTLEIPLTSKTLNINITASIPTGETKILACTKGLSKDIFKNIAVIGWGATAVFGIGLIAFVYSTRNKDINYNIKVKKLLNAYRSYIQQIANEFDASGYQVLMIGSFNEMLDLHDTLGLPILMNENDDKTRTTFVIPTPTKLLYTFEIKVEDYDLIYGISEQAQTIILPEEPVAEPIVEEEIEEVEACDVDDEENGVLTAEDNSKSRFNYSFVAKLTLANHETKEYYKQLLEFISRYDVKLVRSWKRERLYSGRQVFAVMFFRGKTLGVALSLDPKDYQDSKYKFKDISDVKRYAKTPMLMKLTSDRKIRHTMELLDAMLTNAGIKKLENVDFKPEKIKTKTRRQLVKEGLIKTNVPLEEIED